jgi:hypothetical protein
LFSALQTAIKTKKLTVNSRLIGIIANNPNNLDDIGIYTSFFMAYEDFLYLERLLGLLSALSILSLACSGVLPSVR